MPISEVQQKLEILSPEIRFLDEGLGIAVDASRNAYVTGFTDSTFFPTMSAVQPSHGGGISYEGHPLKMFRWPGSRHWLGRKKLLPSLTSVFSYALT